MDLQTPELTDTPNGVDRHTEWLVQADFWKEHFFIWSRVFCWLAINTQLWNMEIFIHCIGRESQAGALKPAIGGPWFAYVLLDYS